MKGIIKGVNKTGTKQVYGVIMVYNTQSTVLKARAWCKETNPPNHKARYITNLWFIRYYTQFMVDNLGCILMPYSKLIPTGVYVVNYNTKGSILGHFCGLSVPIMQVSLAYNRVCQWW